MQVRNPSTYYNLSQPRFINIGDSGSFEMQLRKMYELQSRALVHFDSYVKRGYVVYFFTLTYDNDSLPWYSYEDSVTHRTLFCRCFDRDLVIKFFQDIRKYCDRYYNVHDIPYLNADERGGKRKRPHHHLLIAFPSSLSDDVVYSIIKYCWSFVLRDENGMILRDELGKPIRQSYGWILPSNPYGDAYHRPIRVDVSNTSYACRYASKYCLKNLDDAKDMDVNMIRTAILQNKEYDVYRHFRRTQCKIKLSRYFGATIENDILSSENPYDSLLYGVNIPSICTDEKVKASSYSLRRLTRRLVLDRIETDWKYVLKRHPIYGYKLPIRKRYNRYFYKSVFSDMGKNFEIYKYDSAVSDLAFHFAQQKELILSDSRFLNTYKDVFTHDSLCALFDIDFNNLAVYSYVYKDRLSPSHVELYFTDRNLFDSAILTERLVRTRCGRGWHYYFTEDVYKDFKFVVAPYYASCSFLPQPNDWVMPNGTETIKTMVAWGKSFKCCQCEYDYADFQSADNLPNLYGLYFNSFPCFRGYDDILDIFRLYKYFKSDKYRTVFESIDFTTQIRQDLLEVGNGFTN